MENFNEVNQIIKAELTSDNSDVRSQYLSHFANQVSEFSEGMSRAFLNWRDLDADVKGDEKKAHVSGLVYSAVAYHSMAMKLFLSGYLVPAGNLQRQVIETIALACLCSCKDLGILERYMENKYWPAAGLVDTPLR